MGDCAKKGEAILAFFQNKKKSIYKIRLREGRMMNRLNMSCMVAVFWLMFLVASLAIVSTDGNAKTADLVVASLDVSGPSSAPEAKASIFRGEMITINARLKSDDPARSGPYKIRFYLSNNRNGTDSAYEFDVFHDVSFDKPTGRDGADSKHEFDRFHDISIDKSGSVTVTGRYAFPFSVGAGYTYWVVVEIVPDEKLIESGADRTKPDSSIVSDESKTIRTTSLVTIPCDKFEAYNDGDTYNCPFKPGKED